jgi:parallel beta-helix repeat protein
MRSSWAWILLLVACTGEDKGTDPSDSGEPSPDDTDVDDEPEPPGCIHVDGAGDYETINEAIAAADEGATVYVCAMEESHEEEVVIDKSVSLEGPGIDDLLLVAPVNTQAITISADSVTVSGLTIDTTRSGIQVDTAASVTLADIVITGAGNWGVSASESSDLVMQDLLLTENGYGGIQLAGGSAQVSSSTLADNTSYGIFATDAAQLTVTECVITGTLPADKKLVEDGIGIHAEEGSTLALQSNELTDNTLVHVMTDQTDLSMNSDVLTGGSNGTWSTYGAVSLVGVSVSEAYRFGIYAYTTDPIELSGMQVTGTLETTIEVLDEDWGSDEQGYSGTGISLFSDSITVSETEVEGYNGAGMLLGEIDDGEAWISDVALTDNGRHGLVLYGIDTTADAVDVANLVMTVDQGDELCGYVDRFVGVLSVSNSLVWTGGSITDNDGYGLTGNEASLDISGATIGGNSCAGVMDFFGSSVLTDNDFSQSGADLLMASTVAYYSNGTVIQGNRFTDAQAAYDSIQESTSGKSTTQYIYDLTAGYDLYARETSSVTVSDNVFSDGTNGIYFSSADGTIENNSWTNYLQRPIGIYDSEGSEVLSNTFDGFGFYGVYCSESQVELENNAFSSGGAFPYSYEIYTDEVYQGTYSNNEVGYAIYGYNSSLRIEDSSFTDLDGSVLRSRTYGTEDTTELEDLVLDRIGLSEDAQYSALYFFVSSGSNDVYMDGIQITDVSYDNAIELLSSSYPLTVSASDMSISGTADHGIYLSGAGVDANLEALQISGAASEAIHAISAQLTITDSVLENNDYSGLYIASTSGSVTGNTITTNGTYGMICSGAELDECSDNDLSGNISGESSGCPDTCGESSAR